MSLNYYEIVFRFSSTLLHKIPFYVRCLFSTGTKFILFSTAVISSLNLLLTPQGPAFTQSSYYRFQDFAVLYCWCWYGSWAIVSCGCGPCCGRLGGTCCLHLQDPKDRGSMCLPNPLQHYPHSHGAKKYPRAGWTSTRGPNKVSVVFTLRACPSK
jgi:hypothetical protein